MIDILLPLGTGSKHDDFELRIALRSIEAHAKGWRKIWIVGHYPKFIAQGKRLEHAPCNEFETNHEARIALKLEWAMTCLDMTDDVVLWNDDYVLTQDCDVRKIPPYQRGTLLDVGLAQTPGDYQKSILATSCMLRDAGKLDYNYDLHTPIMFDRAKFTSLREWWAASAVGPGLLTKSTYANWFLPGVGPYLHDLKVTTWDDAARRAVNGRWLFSYGDDALDSGLEQWLRTQFPTKSTFEEYYG